MEIAAYVVKKRMEYTHCLNVKMQRDKGRRKQFER